MPLVSFVFSAPPSNKHAMKGQQLEKLEKLDKDGLEIESD